MFRYVLSNLLLIFIISCGNSPQKPAKESNATIPTIPEDFRNTVFEPIAIKLSSNEKPTEGELLQLAKAPEHRQNLYYLLEYYKRPDLFPQDFFSIEKAAESNLVNWLSHPSELDAIPDEIKLASVESIAEKDTVYAYYVFKFKTMEPHWAAKDGWMLGCVGPYTKIDPPFTWPKATFSRLSRADSVTTKEEAIWNHRHIFKRIVD